MKEILSLYPQIKFKIKCYHYETKEVTSTDSEGNTTTKTVTEKVVTRNDSEYFKYYSCRDVSGPLKLNYDEAIIRKKNLIKLRFKDEIKFADDISYRDYKKSKSGFI